MLRKLLARISFSIYIWWLVGFYKNKIDLLSCAKYSCGLIFFPLKNSYMWLSLLSQLSGGWIHQQCYLTSSRFLLVSFFDWLSCKRYALDCLHGKWNLYALLEYIDLNRQRNHFSCWPVPMWSNLRSMFYGWPST